MTVEVFTFPMEELDSEGVVAHKLPPGYIRLLIDYSYPKQQLLYISNDKDKAQARIYATEIDGVDYEQHSESLTPGELAPAVMVEENITRSLQFGQTHQMPFIDHAGWSRLLVVRYCLNDGFMPVRN